MFDLSDPSAADLTTLALARWTVLHGVPDLETYKLIVRFAHEAVA